MKKLIFSFLLVAALLLTGATAVLAENAPQPASVPDAFCTEEPTAAEQTAALMTAISDEPLYISDIYSDNLYAKMAVGDTFKLFVEFDTPLDARSKLSMTLVNGIGETVAKQKMVSYSYDSDYCLEYVMELTAPINTSDSCFIEFTYTGSYTLEYEEYLTELWPIDTPTIKSAELLDTQANTWYISIANIERETTFSLCWYDFNTADSYWSDVTCDADGNLTVSFGGGDPSSFATIFLCEEGETNPFNCLDDFDEAYYGLVQSGTAYEYGIYTPEHIGANDDSLWLYLSEKSFGYLPYEESELETVSAYMFDVTAKEKVGTLGYREFYEDAGYTEIMGKIELTKELNADHKYIIFVDDGYTVRTVDDFTIMTEPAITNAYFYLSEDDDLNIQPDKMPAGITSFYTYVSTINIAASELGNMSAVLTDKSGAVVATSSYVSGSQYKITASKAITPGSYTMKVSYGNIVYITDMIFSEDVEQELLRPEIHSAHAFNGKTYIAVEMRLTDIDPTELTYKVVKADQTSTDARFHRFLYSGGYYQIFIVSVDSELTDVTYDNEARLEVYCDDELIIPMYPDDMFFAPAVHDAPVFFYSETVDTTDGNVKIFFEGDTQNAIYTLAACDDITDEGKVINLTLSSTEKALTASKADLSAITTLYPVERDSYFYSPKYFHVEENDVRLFGFYGDLGNFSLYEEFAFEKTSTSIPYAALTLPWRTYDYYKLATSEEALASASWQPMETGILYELPDTTGTVKIYGKFKNSEGTESLTYALSTTIDIVAPTFTVELDNGNSYTPDIDEYILIPISYTASEDATLVCEIYAQNDIYTIYRDLYNIYSGTTSHYLLNLYAGMFNYRSAKKMVIYIEDEAGNKSESFEFEIEFKEREYITHPIPGGTITFDPIDKIITNVATTANEVVLPEKINGYDVEAIGDYAFKNCSNMTVLTIPASVEHISYSAFSYNGVLTLLVEKDTEAEWIAEYLGLTYRYIEGIEIIDSLWFTPDSYYVNVARISSDAPETELMAIALYDSGKNLKEIVTDFSAQGELDATFETAVQGDFIKVFRWNSADSLHPIAVVEITLE